MKSLPFAVRAELRGLPTELADIVGAHLVAAGELIDVDPDLAYRHAEAAKRRAARLPIVREALAETAYAAGEYAAALNEFRALRRMSGADDYLAVMADCERALGRHEAALKLIAEARRGDVDADQEVELVLVEAGTRADMGQRPEALRLLKASLAQAGKAAHKAARARLRYAYGDQLLAAGDTAGAERWFESAAGLDDERATDAAERLDALRGTSVDIVELEDDDDVAADDDGDQAAESEHDETGPAENGPAETGPDETGPDETRPDETGPATEPAGADEEQR